MTQEPPPALPSPVFKERRRGGMAQRRPPLIFLLLALLTVAVATVYLIVRTVLFLLNDLPWYERALSLTLLLCEAFILIHGIGYFQNVVKALRSLHEQPLPNAEIPLLEEFPSVAVIVASYREPLEVVENTVICFRNLTYPNKQIYFLDDTRYDIPSGQTPEMLAYRQQIDALCERLEVHLFRRRWHGAKAGMINDFLDFVAGRVREGMEMKYFGDEVPTEPPEFIAIFDADMNPLPDFLEELVRRMQQNPNLAFVQTPQYYTNFETNRVARAAGLQQAIFYEFICEGKSSQDAMFCCGTNVLFRRAALEDVGGFDDSSVTEDFATSLKFHQKGWNSAYVNRTCAFGMGPQELGGYFKQQFRWALGTIGLFRKTLWEFLFRRGGLSASKVWEYFLSGTYYFTGWVFFLMWLMPVLYLFFGVPGVFAYPEIFLAIFFPYLTLTMFTFMITLRHRGYGSRDLFTGIMLSSVTFPVYMKASLLGMLGVKGSFGITPKQGSASLPLRALWPQTTLIVIGFAAIVWGVNRYWFTGQEGPALLVNSLWAAYNIVVLSMIYFFNRPEEA